MKVDRSRILELLLSEGRDDMVDEARRLLPDQVDTERDRDMLDWLEVDCDRLRGSTRAGSAG